MSKSPRTRKVAIIVIALCIVAGAAAVAARGWDRVFVRDNVIAFEPDMPPSSGETPTRRNTGLSDGSKLSLLAERVFDREGMVIRDAFIDGTVVVSAPDVTIENSRIEGGPEGNGITVRGTGSLTILNSEISGFRTGLAGDNWAAIGLRVTKSVGDGVKMGSHTSLRDSLIDEPAPGPGAHFDGIQVETGVEDTLIENNSIRVGEGANSALFLSPTLGPSSDGPLVVRGNHLQGGGYTLYCVDGDRGRFRIRDILIEENVFYPGARFGLVNVNVDVTWRGNTTASGEPLDL